MEERKPKKIIFIAGDKSGDIYGGFLSKKLKDLLGENVLLYSFGGEHLAQHSHQLVNLLNYSVSGIWEVVSSLRKIINIFKITWEKIEKINPHLIILIDFPEFNLRLAKKNNKKYPIFYYVSPQVWAWREKRIELIRKYIDKIIVIFKFEEELYRREGIDVLYFGHPLLEIINDTFFSLPAKRKEKKKIISLLPGSRKNEIKQHLPLLLKAKKLITHQLRDYSFQIIKPKNIEIEFYKKIVKDNTEIIEHSYRSLYQSEFIITSSGTATVEIAILGIPFLIIYKMNLISWLILKHMVNINYIGMINIIAGRKIIEELVQSQASAYRIASLTTEILKNREKYKSLQRNLEKIKQKLYPPSAITATATFIKTSLSSFSTKSRY